MDQEKDQVKGFLGLEIIAPWPAYFPEGKIIEEKDRHITLIFLGEMKKVDLEKYFHFPKPKFRVGLVGALTKFVFLPSKYPRVVAYEVDWIDSGESIECYRKTLMNWLHGENMDIDKKFYPHVTISRGSFKKEDWEKNFSALPFYVNGLHLYESLGNSNYERRSSHPFIPPFEEIHHTADIGYLIRGESMPQVHRNAEIALSFSFPPLVSYLEKKRVCNSIEEVIIDLNEYISRADIEYGCSFKGVSFHGQIQKTKEGIVEWEMIVDV